MTQNQTVSEIKNSGVKREQYFKDTVKTNTEKELLISVIIPLYNEENTIKKVIEKIPNHQRYEIIIVNDGSTDNSVDKANNTNPGGYAPAKSNSNAPCLWVDQISPNHT